MSPWIATIICACGIAGLLYLDREETPRVSFALWIPGLWIAIVGSRHVTEWFGLGPADNAATEGSPLDAAIYGGLLALAILVLIGRQERTQRLLFSNRMLLVYFVYGFFSIVWSFYPEVSLKRWIKSIGDLAIVLVIVTDDYPLVALRRLVARIGFFLLPLSVLFIRFFSDLGRGYSADGSVMNVGVTNNKNMLGLMVLLISLVSLWNLRHLIKNRKVLNRGRRLMAQGTLFAFGLVLFVMADCSTCIACFVVGAFIMLTTGRRKIRSRPARIHAFCVLMVMLSGIGILLGVQDFIIEALGREANLTGRTDVWTAVIQAAPNALVGAGFEGFWFHPNVEIARQYLLDNADFTPRLAAALNEAHNGYIETYLNLGWIGVLLISAVLLSAYTKSVQVFREDSEVGSFALAVVAVAVLYGISEAGFRIQNPAWIFLLLVVVSASGFAAGLFEEGMQWKAGKQRLGLSRERSYAEQSFRARGVLAPRDPGDRVGVGLPKGESHSE